MQGRSGIFTEREIAEALIESGSLPNHWQPVHNELLKGCKSVKGPYACQSGIVEGLSSPMLIAKESELRETLLRVLGMGLLRVRATTFCAEVEFRNSLDAAAPSEACVHGGEKDYCFAGRDGLLIAVCYCHRNPVIEDEMAQITLLSCSIRSLWRDGVGGHWRICLRMGWHAFFRMDVSARRPRRAGRLYGCAPGNSNLLGVRIRNALLISKSAHISA